MLRVIVYFYDEEIPKFLRKKRRFKGNRLRTDADRKSGDIFREICDLYIARVRRIRIPSLIGIKRHLNNIVTCRVERQASSFYRRFLTLPPRTVVLFLLTAATSSRSRAADDVDLKF